jgi:single-stranded DNA-specific DHH superfamily exonuclease
VCDASDRYGGHHAAAGFSLQSSRCPSEGASGRGGSTLPPNGSSRASVAHGYLAADDHVPVRALARTAGPFGQGFQYPTFAARDMRITDSRQLAAGQHWKVKLVRRTCPSRRSGSTTDNWPSVFPLAHAWTRRFV